jgi:phosphoribosylaminoimidazolecarboxamide formyltransferase/IMP cyclohydrolase
VGRIETALISVADKTGLDEVAKRLSDSGVGIIASGGTAGYLRNCEIDVTDISEITGRVEFLGGLVKTLHPGIHAGILADRRNGDHMKELADLGYRKIDMVIVNFYPLTERPAVGDLSFIDIGGPAMARAAAKNLMSCAPVPHPAWYRSVIDQLGASGGIDVDLRWKLACDTLVRTGAYDAGILSVVGEGPDIKDGPNTLLFGMEKGLELRYGENPHQRAAFY